MPDFRKPFWEMVREAVYLYFHPIEHIKQTVQEFRKLRKGGK